MISFHLAALSKGPTLEVRTLLVVITTGETKDLCKSQLK